MTRQEQKQINDIVQNKLNEFTTADKTVISVKNLRYCNAKVYECVMKETGEIIYALKSYDTYIAFIDGNRIYDFLRLVYGYTATSAKHIAYFMYDYIDKYYDETIQFRYYPLRA